MEAHTKQVNRTAHYYTLGTPGPKIKNFWIVCHGYGQLAKRFIYKFRDIASEETLVLAPEGFSRFYLPDRQVGTSWMTREDRLDEIDDYANYLQELYEEYRAQLPENVRIVLLGFSQGCATQVRWIMKKFPNFHHLVLWGGQIPEDLDYRPHLEYWTNKDIHQFFGSEDEFIKEKHIKEQKELITTMQLQVAGHAYEGKHKIYREVLSEWWDSIRS